MLKILGQIPREHFHLACSGGSDSMAMMHLLLKYPRNRFDVLHFNHGTPCCGEAESFVKDFCTARGIELHVGRMTAERRSGESQEEYWRNQRYAFFKKFSDEKIVMTHHLSDCVETWVMTSLNGRPQVIPYCNPKYNVIRPLLLNPKSAIEKWISDNRIEYVYDRSNSDTDINRNYVRHVMMKHILRINPGIEKTVKKLVLENYAACTAAC